MQYIVLDMEWNQALTKESVRRKGFTLSGEIIQIGAVRLTPQFETVDTFRIAVAPKYYKKMHWSVRKLTGISTKNLADGIPFPEAYRQFAAWCGKDYVFLTWGPDDLPMLKCNLRLHNMSLADVKDGYDLQKIFGRMVGEKKQFSLADALTRLEITDTYPPHDALNDAMNTARICSRIPLEEAILHYNDAPKPAKKKTDAPAPPRATKEEALKASGVSRTRCPQCGEPLRFGKWLRRAPGRRVSLASCACGAEFLMKLNWETSEDGTANVTHTLVPASKEQAAAYTNAVTHRHRSRRPSAKADVSGDSGAQ